MIPPNETFWRALQKKGSLVGERDGSVAKSNRRSSMRKRAARHTTRRDSGPHADRAWAGQIIETG